MLKILKTPYLFTIFYFTILTIDIIVKLSFEGYLYRMISKPLTLISLIVYYIINQKEQYKQLFFFMIGALIFFLVGDFFMIFYRTEILYMVGIFFFIFAKVFYIFRFSRRKDYDLIKLIPIIILCFAYMALLLALTYNNLGHFLLPTLIYLFVMMTLVLFAYIRKQSVNYRSYVLVTIGIICSICSDSITLLKSFYDKNFGYSVVTIMLFYGISQYFVVMGIVKETNP